MNNLLKITVVMFGSLFLFACDSSNTAAVKKAGKSYSVSVKVSGLKGAIKFLDNNNIDDIIPFNNSNAEKTFTAKIAEGGNYKVTILDKSQTNTQQTCTLAINSTGTNMTANVIVDFTCGSTGVGNLSSIEKGEIYYMSECAVCHRAGVTVDPSSTFGTNGDLAGDYRIAKNNTTDLTIEATFFTNMHLKGPKRNLMGRFDKVPAQSLADLKAYLLNIAP